MGWLAGGELLVVETEDDWFLGSVEVRTDVLIMRTGFAGRPVVLEYEDVVRITQVGEHQELDS